MKESHKLFFAIPFDAATKKLYERICDRIRQRYPGITTVIGNQEVGPSPEYSEFGSFKAQNRELSRQFVAQIIEADIIIADLTHNNPNVHVELGIALMENKNILRVTGRTASELGFDIRNLHVYAYQDEEQLAGKIEKYLDTFFKIKKLPISPEYDALYCEEPIIPLELRAFENPGLRFESNCSPDFKIRDGAVRVEFELLETRTPNDWFGVFFRSGDSPTLSSNLVYVRKNGMVEIAVFPGPHVIERLSSGQQISGKQVLEIEFENNQLELQMGPVHLQTERLSHQTTGRILPAVHDANANVHALQMICRDTIEWEPST